MDDYADVVGAQHLWGTVFVVDFSDGGRAVVDVSSFMSGPLYDQLMAEGQLDQFEVDDTIGTLVWPNGMDVAPSTLRAHAALDSDARPPADRPEAPQIEVEPGVVVDTLRTIKGSWTVMLNNLDLLRVEVERFGTHNLGSPDVILPGLREIGAHTTPLPVDYYHFPNPASGAWSAVHPGHHESMRWSERDEEEFRKSAL